MSTPWLQEMVALLIVSCVLAICVWKFMKPMLVGQLAKYLLKRGKIKWAMRLKALDRPIRSSKKKTCCPQ